MSHSMTYFSIPWVNWRAITGATIQETNKDIIYTELGLDHSWVEDGIKNYFFTTK